MFYRMCSSSCLTRIHKNIKFYQNLIDKNSSADNKVFVKIRDEYIDVLHNETMQKMMMAENNAKRCWTKFGVSKYNKEIERLRISYNKTVIDSKPTCMIERRSPIC
jgi:hypothetical protein